MWDGYTMPALTDYITKPLHPDEAVARVQAVSDSRKRSSGAQRVSGN